MATFRKLALESSPTHWATATATANLLTIVASTVMVTLLVLDKNWWHRVGYAVLTLLLVGLSAWLIARATQIREARFPKNAPVVLEMLRVLASTAKRENDLRSALKAGVDANQRRRVAIHSLKIYLSAIEDILSNAWSTKVFGQATPVEVVLMKRAADNEVTVACWANTRPTSLDQRSGRPTFYANTEAAKLYRKHVDNNVRSPILLISDISKYDDYDHFGRDATLRTNSTALFPLYDITSVCHGFVAITARNRAGMFSPDDRDFWDEVWRMWEPNLVRCIADFEATGQLLDEETSRV